MVEIIVVVVIIGLLATLILPKFFGRVGQAKQSVAKNNIRELETAIETFYLDYGRFPQSHQELITRPSDVDAGKWRQPAVKPSGLIDPWKNQYTYTYPGQYSQYDLKSLGADGQDGGEGDNADINNWEL